MPSDPARTIHWGLAGAEGKLTAASPAECASNVS